MDSLLNSFHNSSIDNSVEEWRDVKDFPGYKISSFGKLKYALPDPISTTDEQSEDDENVKFVNNKSSFADRERQRKLSKKRYSRFNKNKSRDAEYEDLTPLKHRMIIWIL